MRIVTLVENTACASNCQQEHGLSLYLETGNHKILFDMGQSDAFARNAEKLGIDLSQVDFAVLSHGHYDHGGGLETFLKINAKAPVYIHNQAFGEHYNAAGKYIGLNTGLQQEPRLHFAAGTSIPAPGMKLTDCNDLEWDFSPWGLSCRKNGLVSPDDFLHEHYLLITEGQKRILISGCSHKGIVNLAEHFKPDVLVGGFHLNKEKNTAVLTEIAQGLKKTDTQYYTGHCTGDLQFDVMKQILGSKLERITTGTVIEV